jgi:hypothetical protein
VNPRHVIWNFFLPKFVTLGSTAIHIGGMGKNPGMYLCNYLLADCTVKKIFLGS